MPVDAVDDLLDKDTSRTFLCDDKTEDDPEEEETNPVLVLEGAEIGFAAFLGRADTDGLEVDTPPATADVGFFDREAPFPEKARGKCD